MRYVLALLTVVSMLWLAPTRTASAGVVIHDKAPPFRTAALTLDAGFRSSHASVPGGVYIIEIDAQMTVHGVVIQDLTARLLHRSSGKLVQRGEVRAVLQVPAAYLKGRQVGFADLGFANGHTAHTRLEGDVLHVVLEGAHGATIHFSLNKAK